MKILFALAISSLIYVNASASCVPSKLNGTLSLMGQRESIMKKVAAYKWYYAPNHQVSAYSAPQEIKVLKNVSLAAKKIGLNPPSLLVFSQIQMDLSKQIESYWIEYWNNPDTPEKDKPTKATLESLTLLRQELKSIDQKLFPVIRSEMPYIQQCSINQLRPKFAQVFDKVAGIPKQPNFIDMLIQSLQSIKSK